MYVVTFYSFKGGVGRTMALVNVGLSLASRGKRVLLVDFDLEAPGIQTFDLLKPSSDTPGVVDFVHDYLESGEAPDVSQYVYECKNSAWSEGSVLVMPAGRHDSAYGGRLNSINWQKLYEQNAGYLLFEDLKAQWAASLRPDYVLIDSRTGHTDVGGICTRQLPDAVTILFFPNDQNLLGLDRIVSDIRAERDGYRKKDIRVLFVTSNVPDLDDEDHILADRVDAFQRTLGYDSPTAVIHHYGSLALLNQTVFSVERPRSRLAAEYENLVRAISQSNPSDREGALSYLRDTTPSGVPIDLAVHIDDLKKRLAAIEDNHRKDPEVMFRLSIAWEDLGDPEAALRCLNASIEHGDLRPEAFRRRIQLSRLAGDEQSHAVADATQILSSGDATYQDVLTAVTTLKRRDAPALQGLTRLLGFQSLSIQDRARLAERLLASDTLSVMSSVVDSIPVEGTDGEAADHVGLCLMGLGRYDDARSFFLRTAAGLESLDAFHAFNGAMADWALERVPRRELFAQAVDTALPSSPNANYSQCMAMAEWVLGNRQAVQSRIGEARQLIGRDPRPFSAWRYLFVKRDEFLADLRELEAIVDEPPTIPPPLSGRAAEHRKKETSC